MRNRTGVCSFLYYMGAPGRIDRLDVADVRARTGDFHLSTRATANVCCDANGAIIPVERDAHLRRVAIRQCPDASRSLERTGGHAIERAHALDLEHAISIDFEDPMVRSLRPTYDVASALDPRVAIDSWLEEQGHPDRVRVVPVVRMPVEREVEADERLCG